MTSTLRGQLDSVDRTVIRGWAQDAWRPAQPVSLLVTVNGTLLGRIIANRFRQDLADAGLGTGRHAFELQLGNALSPVSLHQVRVTRELDGVELDRSPWLLEPVPVLDQAALDRLSDLLGDGVETDRAGLDRRLDFLMHQLDRLLTVRARQQATGGAPDGDAAAWRASRVAPSAAAPRVGGRQALVIDELMPDGGRDAGSCAVLSHMLSLRRLGYAVLFVPASLSPTQRDGPLPARLAALGITVCTAPYYASVEEVLRRHGAGLGLVYLHRGPTAFRYARLVRHHCPRARVLYAVADLHHLRLARQAAVERRPELLPLARQHRQRELDSAAMADVVLTHSSHEAGLLAQALPQATIHVVPWAVPLRPVAAGFFARLGVAFLADYAHAPNLEAAHRLVREIMPLVWEHAPDLPCLLAGSRMPPGLFGSDPRLVPVGHVPELATLFGRVRLTVAPLSFGAGIKGKVMESLAAGVPCVCSPVAAEGLDLPASLVRWIAGDTHGLARAILTLHRDPALNRSAAQAGLDWAQDRLSADRIDRLLEAAVSWQPVRADRERAEAG